MTRVAADWGITLRQHAAAYAATALANIQREFPTLLAIRLDSPADVPRRPRELTPVFYGSFDWHSCVEMHWVLVRLLRSVPESIPEHDIRRALDQQFTAEGLAAEARFMARPGNRGRERPYGWGWALQMVYDVETWDDPDARRWASNLRPLAETLTSNFLDWLPKATYPIRYGVHQNSAFGLSRTLPHARRLARDGEPALLEVLTRKAMGWFAADVDYPARWEPSGADFLSPALVEAELMAQLLPEGQFARWLEAFLPAIGSAEPRELFTAATVSDASDGQIAHLHGLNLSRAWGWRRLAEMLPPGDPRVESALQAMRTHAAAALPHVTGDDYMVDHWLAAYAVLLMTE
ncbi:MAG: DUF2891 domain-containing protein [Chloroflexi bacterium]|nr:DUF2891 domain-containing protein [Chloroflexota bacterium]